MGRLTADFPGALARAAIPEDATAVPFHAIHHGREFFRIPLTREFLRPRIFVPFSSFLLTRLWADNGWRILAAGLSRRTKEIQPVRCELHR